MISFIPVDDSAVIGSLKNEYYRSLLAPMDGMWDTGFTNPAPHWEILVEEQQAGYFVLSKEGALLQFYVTPGFHNVAKTLLDQVIDQHGPRKFVVSTIDPAFLVLCLDIQNEITVHTLLYETSKPMEPSHKNAASISFRLVAENELSRVVALQERCLGFERGSQPWLEGYSENLMARAELSVLAQGDDWIGFGEERTSETQHGVVDLGMMVHPDYRGQGWATYILKTLACRVVSRGGTAICSTTTDNPASQISIIRSGFRATHRIMDIAFGA